MCEQIADRREGVDDLKINQIPKTVQWCLDLGKLLCDVPIDVAVLGPNKFFQGARTNPVTISDSSDQIQLSRKWLSGSLHEAEPTYDCNRE